MTDSPVHSVGPAGEPPAFQLRKVDFAYPSHSRSGPGVVLRQVSLTIPRGQLWVILGPNGSGKTTMLRLMAGLVNPTAGLVLLDDVSLSRQSSRRIARSVAFVPQETMPAFNFSVLQMVLMGRSPHLGSLGFERPIDLAIARECLAKTDAAHLAERQFDELSSGERQRVVIARALAQRPRILLLDEPTSFLDIAHQLQIHRLLCGLVAEGITVVCVSHDINAAAQFADRLALLKAGQIVSCGPVEQVLTCQTIKDVYGVAVEVMAHPATGRPIVLPQFDAPCPQIGQTFGGSRIV